MQEILIKKLHHYISENNPDLLLTLRKEKKLFQYLNDNVASVDDLLNQLLSENKPVFLIEELCMEELTKPLKPSRFYYVKCILEEEFKKEFYKFQRSNILTIEIINILVCCDPVFDEFRFSEETENSQHLRYMIMGTVYEYLHQ